MSSVETGQMSAVETGQMTAAETSVLSQQKTSFLSQQKTSVLSQHQILCVSDPKVGFSPRSAQASAQVLSSLTTVPVPPQNIKFGPKWVENRPFGPKQRANESYGMSGPIRTTPEAKNGNKKM